MSIYTRLYHNLVESSKHLKEQWKPVGSGLERHHIIPKHAGGTDEESNFTYLTHREHIAAHWLLWKIHGRRGDLIAWTRNLKKSGHWRHTEESKEKIVNSNKNRTISKETRELHSVNSKSQWRKSKAEGNLVGNRKGVKTLIKIKTGERFDFPKGINFSLEDYRPAQSKYLYITPFGSFYGPQQFPKALKGLVSYPTVIGWCKNPNKKLNKQACNACKFLNSIDKGKTFGELGFNNEKYD